MKTQPICVTQRSRRPRSPKLCPWGPYGPESGGVKGSNHFPAEGPVGRYSGSRLGRNEMKPPYAMTVPRSREIDFAIAKCVKSLVQWVSGCAQVLQMQLLPNRLQHLSFGEAEDQLDLRQLDIPTLKSLQLGSRFNQSLEQVTRRWVRLLVGRKEKTPCC